MSVQIIQTTVLACCSNYLDSPHVIFTLNLYFASSADEFNLDSYMKYNSYEIVKIYLNILIFSLAQLVKVLMALAIYLTYSLMLYVPAEIMWPHLAPRFHSEKAKCLGEYAFRAFLVLLTCKYVFVCN